MDEFDKQIKNNLKAFLRKNIHFNSIEKEKLFDNLSKKKKNNFAYYNVISILVTLCFVLIVTNMDRIAPLEVLKINTAPFSLKNTYTKDTLTIENSENETEKSVIEEKTEVIVTDEQSEDRANKIKEDNHEDKKNKEYTDSFEKLTLDKMELITVNNLSEIINTMEEIQQEYRDTLPVGWSIEDEKYQEQLNKIYNKASEELSSLMTKKEMELELDKYVEAFFCNCDSIEVPHKNIIGVRLQIVNQTPTSFIFSYITPDTGYLQGIPGTSFVHYIKEDGVWKFNGINFISPEEQPLNITRKDLNEFYAKYYKEAKIINEEMYQGEEYFIVKRTSWISVINKKDGSSNKYLLQKYSESSN